MSEKTPTEQSENGSKVLTRRDLIKNAASGVAGLALVGLTGSLASGQEFPSRKIELICPWAAGGGTDRTSRAIAKIAEDHLGVPLYVVNRTGGSGAVGHSAAAYATPDGYTVGIMTVEICTIRHLGIAPIGPEIFEPIMQYNFDPASLAVRADAPWDTIDEFIDYAKKNPGEIRVGNSGTGAIWHLAAAGFGLEVGIGLSHVPFDGAAPAIKSVIAGEIEATTASAVEVLPQVPENMKVLAYFGEERFEKLPEVPTLKEKGIDFTMGAWRGLGASGGTLEERVKILHDGFKATYEDEEFKQFMEKQGFGMVYKGLGDYEEFLTNEDERFGKIIENLGL